MITGDFVPANFIVPLNWEFKKFDLKLINNISFNHPYQKTIYYIYFDYGSYLNEDEEEDEEDILNDIGYFQLLDRYYRYGITFDDSELYPKKCFGLGNPFSDTLLVLEYNTNNYQERYLIENCYRLKDLLFNDVKLINLDDVDNGPITLSEVEKWKRKVVNQQTDKRKKLQLLDPNVYHSLITFVAFSKFEGRPHQKIDYELSWEGFEDNNVVDRKLNNYKDKYKHRKMYEDKIYNKIKNFLK